MQPLRVDQIHGEFNKVYSEKYCLHPDPPNHCSTKHIAAHTVQNNGQLSLIAEGGHVMGVDRSYLNYRKDQPPFTKIGVNDASTHYCFCHTHDCETFAPIETTAFQFRPEQCFLLGYRGVCRAVYLARQHLKTIPLFRQFDFGRPLIDQERIQTEVTDLQKRRLAELEIFERTKRIYDGVLQNRSFDEIAFRGIEFDNLPEILGSNVFLPQSDWAGGQLQPLQIGSAVDVMTFSVIATPSNRGAAVFVWHKQHDKACRALVDSLISLGKTAIPHAIVRLLFSLCENSYFRIQWWENLPCDTKGALERRFIEGTRGNCDLSDDGLRIVNWPVSRFR